MFRFANLFIAVAVLPGFGAIASAQTDSWQKIAPVGQPFTVLMPTKATGLFRLIPLGDDQGIPIRIYCSVAAKQRFCIAGVFESDSVSGLSSFENFVGTFEGSFKNTGITATLDREISVKGIKGREYRIRLNKYGGTARLLQTNDEFFVLFVIGAGKTDKDLERFFSSFALGALNTDVESSGVSVGVVTMIGTSSSTVPKIDMEDTQATENDISTIPELWPRQVGPIMGGVLNGKVIHLVQPAYPAIARSAHASGQVNVQVIIDENGTVISAVATSGHPLLQAAAIQAARSSTFTPTKLFGQPVRVNGVIIYNFVGR